MVEIPWTPIHEPIFLDLDDGITCCVLRLPANPRNNSISNVTLAHSEERMTPQRKEQHAAGRFCLSEASRKEGITGQISLSENFPLRLETSNGMVPVSISHSDSLAVAVIGKGYSQIGVDLEPKERQIRNSILDQFCTPEEIDSLSNESSDYHRLNVWMAKEAVSKATGQGMATAKQIKIDGEFAGYQSKNYRLFQNEFENHFIMIAVPYSDSSIES